MILDITTTNGGLYFTGTLEEMEALLKELCDCMKSKSLFITADTVVETGSVVFARIR